ncbi:MAG: alpha-glucan family phosphorylase [Mariprofundaceae bacterium]
MKESGQHFYLQVRPIIPDELSRLEELAGDLWFAWNARARMLFFMMDPVLWSLCGHNPRTFLRRISQKRLDEIAKDRAFLSHYNGVMSDYDTYKNESHLWYHNAIDDADEHLVAYFSAEFGLHESLPIYSGGLGILAGDHCKSASDLGLHFIGVGLLYRHGYFTQTIDAQGQQIASYMETRFEDLCTEPALDKKGNPVVVQVELPGRNLDLKVWKTLVGHISLLLLDADLPSNTEEDRKITYQLYGGGMENRIKQEICLGIGGVRALRATGITPTAWHMNEGHAAFIILERMREYKAQSTINNDEALEITKSSTIFTTHTAVPAGHDIFPHEMFDAYFSAYAKKAGISMSYLHHLGKNVDHGSGFNMTTLAIRGSSYQNGVSKLHGEVSREMCASIWPDVPSDESPITSITNGVHVTTWLAPEWVSAFDMHLGGRWRGHLLDPDFWEKIQDIPDQLFWSIHQTNKQRMLQHVRELLLRQAKRNGESEEVVRELTSCFDPRTLVIGFARRFATYKRATLLFHDEEKLLKILRDTDRPVVFLFAGKAHPADNPGQDLIRRIHQISRMPEFVGRILMLEAYNMTLSRYMLSGVDVWMNNPRRPLEASGTSGMKAAMNGAPNLSVLDGWWPEGYEGDNGWVIGGEHELAEDALTDEADALSLYHVLAYDLIPTYYRRNDSGFSEEWIRIAKRAMISAIPHFNTDRMVADYVKHFYVPASRRAKKLTEKENKGARELAAWKARVINAWPKVSMNRADSSIGQEHWNFGDKITLGMQLKVDGLSPDDICVEAVLSRPSRTGDYKKHSVVELEHLGDGKYTANIHPDDTGNFAYQVRMYPTHPDLAHPYSLGLMKWL